MKEQSTSKDNSQEGTVANAGWMRPPLIYLSFGVLAVVLNALVPLRFVTNAISIFVSLLLVALGVVLFAWSLISLRRGDTPLSGNKRTRAIVERGPFRFSRNPVYLAFMLLGLGTFVGTGIYWLLGGVVAATWVVATIIVPREEQFLSSVFAEQYVHYRTRVRRWL